MSIDKAYDSWSEMYDTNKNRTRDLDKKVSQKVLGQSNYNRILELGCGTGKNTEWLLDKCEEILPVDFSDKMLAIAKKKIQSPKVNFEKLDLLTDWNMPDNYYDLVTCNLVLEHIENLEDIFRKAASKLKSGGSFFISELHPFKQYTGTKARYETNEGTRELVVFIHHVTDFINAAISNNFRLDHVGEWFDDDDKNELPRIISFLFKKN